MNKVSLVVITDGRQDCINKTIQSIESIIDYPFYERIIINDSGDPRYDYYLKSSFKGFGVISHETRRGLAGAVQSAWSNVSSLTDYIFHLEDDFIFNCYVDIDKMIDLLNKKDTLTQMALVRAPVNPPEEEVGGFVFQHLEDYHQHDGWFDHQRLFTLNPSIYKLQLAQIGWPDHGGESEFTNKLHSINTDYCFGFYGDIYDKPYVTHIGGRRSEGWFL